MKGRVNREAFTMIEVLFVIVIIGILAAIALPRLVATRDDAQLAVTAHDTMVAANDIAAYAVARGETKANLSEMSYAIKTMSDKEWVQDTGNYEARISAVDVPDCIRLKIEGHGQPTEVLKIINGGGSGAECDRLRGLIDQAAFPIPLRGARISI